MPSASQAESFEWLANGVAKDTDRVHLFPTVMPYTDLLDGRHPPSASNDWDLQRS